MPNTQNWIGPGGGAVTDDDFWDALTRAVPAARFAAARVVGDGPDADDCVASALESAAAGAAIDSPAGWLCEVSRRRAVDLVRQREREQRAWGRLGRLQVRAEPDFADDVVDQVTARWLADEAACLPDTTQLVLARVQEGAPASRVADEFGLTRRSVESHVLRARRTLREAWARSLAALIGVGVAMRKQVSRSGSPAATGLTAASAMALFIAAPLLPNSAVTPPGVVHLTKLGAPATVLAVPAQQHAALTIEGGRRTRSRQRDSDARPRELASARTAVASAKVTKEHRPGPEDPVGSVLYCVSTFRVSGDHIGC